MSLIYFSLQALDIVYNNGVSYVAIDTAGLKKKGKIFESIDKQDFLHRKK